MLCQVCDILIIPVRFSYFVPPIPYDALLETQMHINSQLIGSFKRSAYKKMKK